MSVGPGEFSGVGGVVQPPPHEETPGEEAARQRRDAQIEDEAAWKAQQDAIDAQLEEQRKQFPNG